VQVELGKNITVGSSNVDVGEALTHRAKEELIGLASKYFGKLTHGSVHFSRDGHLYRCSITLQPGGVALLSAEAEHKDAHAAFTDSAEKLAKQLRRLKREVRDGKQPR